MLRVLQARYLYYGPTAQESHVINYHSIFWIRSLWTRL